MPLSPISEFRKQFKLDKQANLAEVAVAVDAIYKAFAVASEHLHNIEPGNDASLGFRLRAFVNLLGRVFEHAQAMLVALATGSPSSSEALARIVVEGSVNLTYLAVVGDSTTLIQFFREWLQDHKKRLAAWRTEIKGEAYAPRVLTMISEREKVVDGFGTFVDHLEDHLALKGSRAAADWPRTLFARFEALGRQTDYYESYHRLSGASHITAEDTLTWLVSLHMENEKVAQLGQEAWAYSTMMTRIAATFFIDAVAACVIMNGRSANEDLTECKLNLTKAAVEISKKAGVPL